MATRKKIPEITEVHARKVLGLIQQPIGSK
jgi:hypothetical protein